MPGGGMRVTMPLLLLVSLLWQIFTGHQAMSAQPAAVSSSSSSRSLLRAADMGVAHCRLLVDGAALGSELGYAGTFALHIFLRYTTFGNASKVKGCASVELLEPVHGQRQDVMLNPHVSLVTSNTTFHMRGTITFPLAPITIAAAASPLFVKFSVPPGFVHQFNVTSLGANGSCPFTPLSETNHLDSHGANVPIVKDPTTQANEAFIVMSPFYNVRQPNSSNVEKFAVLLGRHIQWHEALGFSRHVVYMRPDDIREFSQHPLVRHWLQSQQLLLVLWESIVEQPGLPYFDQRIVYSHAVLAFTGLNVHLAMVDLDEYLMSLRDDLGTFQQMSRACKDTAQHIGSGQRLQQPVAHEQQARLAGRRLAGSSGLPAMVSPSLPRAAQPLSLLVTRYHSLALHHHHASGAEADMWVSSGTSAEHPLQRYTIVNKLRPPAVKSIVRPEFVRTFNIHFGSLYDAFSSSLPDPDCLFILHLRNLLSGRDRPDSKLGLRRLGFTEDLRLAKAFARPGETVELQLASIVATASAHLRQLHAQ